MLLAKRSCVSYIENFRMNDQYSQLSGKNSNVFFVFMSKGDFIREQETQYILGNTFLMHQIKKSLETYRKY